MSAPDNDTVGTDTATVDEVAPDAALPDADPASVDARLEPADLDDADDDDAEDEDGDDEVGDDEVGGDAESLLVREGDVAGDYLERLLDILDVDGDIDLDVEGDRASVAVVGGQLKTLIGPDGATLEALQELTRLAVAQSTGVRSRLMLDIGGFRAKRRADLTDLAQATAERVAQSGQPERLSPMNPFERKVVHDVIAAAPGVRSESEGEEPNRRVVVLPEK
ncbi:protein jag [Modestobacter sp. NPDC049651]|uniref:Jag family protein n=1 Tax=unclassified Modestobacter TaxID=2643866 RepID=UPI0033F6AFEA